MKTTGIRSTPSSWANASDAIQAIPAATIATRETYGRAGLVSISPGSTHSQACRGHPFAFRNVYRDDDQALWRARFAARVVGAKRVAVFHDQDDYGAALHAEFVREAKALGLDVVDEIAFDRRCTQDYGPLVRRLEGRVPDAVFVSGLFGEAAARRPRGEGRAEHLDHDALRLRAPRRPASSRRTGPGTASCPGPGRP